MTIRHRETDAEGNGRRTRASTHIDQSLLRLIVSRRCLAGVGTGLGLSLGRGEGIVCGPLQIPRGPGVEVQSGSNGDKGAEDGREL